MSEETRLPNELRAVMDTLRRRDQQYRLLAEQAADGVLLATADGRIADASPGAAALVGRPRAELLKLALSDLIEPDKAVDNVAGLLALPPEGTSPAPSASAVPGPRRSRSSSAPGVSPTAGCSSRCGTSRSGAARPRRSARARSATSGSPSRLPTRS